MAMAALEAMTQREIDAILQGGFRYAYSLTHDRPEAEDLLQEACVSILGAGAPWDRAYLFTTIRNRFIDRYRRNQKVLFLPLEGERDGELIEPQFAIEGWEAPDYLGNGQLDRALSALRPEERETIFLAVVEGYTAQEIAGMTGRPRGTILSLLHRTRHKLRRLLEGEDAAGARS
jgi:RNA polymerase sigma-70 factor (ECF subfamily)